MVKEDEPMYFTSMAEAVEWANKNFEFMDNFRWAPLSKPEDMEIYSKQKSAGCCGSWDSVVWGPEGETLMGFNYGH